MGAFKKILRKFFHFIVFVYILYLIYNYNLSFTKYTNDWFYLCTFLIFYYLIYDFISKSFITNMFNLVVNICELCLTFGSPYLLDSINYVYLNMWLFKFIRVLLRIINTLCRHFR